MTDPTAKAALRDNFSDHIQSLIDYQNRRFESGTNPATQFEHYRPPDSDWSGDLFDITGISKAFSRESQSQDFQAAASAGGTRQDYVLVLLQGDFIAVLERAFRSRHHTAVRTRLHATARYRGHAAETGVLSLGLRGYIEWLEKQANVSREPTDGS